MVSGTCAGHQQGSEQPYRSASMGWQSDATPPNGSTSQPGSEVVEQPATLSIASTSATCPSATAVSNRSALWFVGFSSLIESHSSARGDGGKNSGCGAECRRRCRLRNPPSAAPGRSSDRCGDGRRQTAHTIRGSSRPRKD